MIGLGLRGAFPICMGLLFFITIILHVRNRWTVVCVFGLYASFPRMHHCETVNISQISVAKRKYLCYTVHTDCYKQHNMEVM